MSDISAQASAAKDTIVDKGIEAKDAIADAASSATKKWTYEDVSNHNTRKDLYVVIHDKDEHPGGEEVLLDVAGIDATDSYVDVGHSDEATEILQKLYVADLERKDGDPKPHAFTPKTFKANEVAPQDNGMGSTLIIILTILVAAIGYFVFQNLNKTSVSAVMSPTPSVEVKYDQA